MSEQISKKSKEHREKEMELEIKKWKSSGLSKNRYCKENGHTKTTFSYWVNKIEKKVQQKETLKTKLTKIPYNFQLGIFQNIKPEAKTTNYEIKLHLGKHMVEIGENFSAQTLKKLLIFLAETEECNSFHQG